MEGNESVLRLRYRWLLAMSTCLGLLALGAPSAVNAYKRWRDVQRRASLAELLNKPSPSEEDWTRQAARMGSEAGGGPLEEEWDDPFRRMVASRMMWGSPRADVSAQWARIAYDESRKWAHLLPHPPRSAVEAALAPLAPTIASGWINLGPTDALFEFNAVQYPEVDSGRVTDIRVSPTSPATVYVATSGGGIWKTFNFGTGNPTWSPITEGLGNLAIGAMEMDPTAPDTLYAGTGDFVDVAGGQILKTLDGGSTWSAPVTLSGAYPSLAVTALRIRTIRVDPANPQVVLVGTNVGLFRSINGGGSFTLIDLPNSGTGVPEGVWSIVYTGSVGGVSRWALSGVYASVPNALPPQPGVGTSSNPGDIWISTDAGATWSSRRAAGTLPNVAVGRITLAAGTPSAANPPVTVIYAQLGNADESSGSSQVGTWRSSDSGSTFLDATGTLANPTKATTTAAFCIDSNVAGGQAWYNQALAVDPADDNRVIMGGNFCGVRTRNGLSGSPVWENVSHWLPAAGIGNTADGTLPYVHADWHTAQIVRIGGGYRVLVGCDGGLYFSDNVFDPGTITDSTVTWSFPNRGIVTHLAYSVASGDPVDGNPFVAFAGLQDNGTRFRDSPAHPSAFNQVIGGDGVGVTRVTAGHPARTLYWASVNGNQRYCNPGTSDCNSGSQWSQQVPTPSCAKDASPFFIRYAPVNTNTAGPTVLSFTSEQVFRLTGDPGTGATWQPISPCFDGTVQGVPATALRQIFASPTIDGLYGVPTNGGKFLVTSNCQAGAATACSWRWSPTSTSFDLNGNGTLEPNEMILGTTSIAFPPTTPAGKNPGDVYVGASGAPTAVDGQPVSPALGHLFITQDGGTRWTPLHGNGTGFDLPNVPISVVRYDPDDLTNNTLYAGTDLGLYRSIDGGQTWQRYGAGLPLVKVTDLFIGKAGHLIRVSTYGRGIWELYPLADVLPGQGTGDFDNNQQIDGVDLGELSSRLGTDPTTLSQPYYDWSVDMVGGTTKAIDESDLSLLLTRFGGHP